MNRILYEQRVTMDKGDFKQEVRLEEKLLESGYWKVIFRFHLIGEKGASQFVFHILTKYPEEAQDFYHGRWEGFRWNGFDGMFTPSGGHVMATDVGFHSRVPDEGASHFEECDVLGGECWYDGSTLLAYDLMREYLQKRDPRVIWNELYDVYHSRAQTV